jgi:hypothetical protein
MCACVVCFYVWILYVLSSTYIFTYHLSIVGIFFLSFILLIGWQFSIWNCCRPFFPLLYNCQLLCFRLLALCIIVKVFLQPFFLESAPSRMSVEWVFTGWMVQGSNPHGDYIFSTCPDQPEGPPSPPIQGYWVSFPGKKRQGCGVDHLPQSNTKVKEWVEQYLISLAGPVLRWTLPLPLPFTLSCHHLKINYGHFISSQTELCMNDSISYFISSASVFHLYCILKVF